MPLVFMLNGFFTAMPGRKQELARFPY